MCVAVVRPATPHMLNPASALHWASLFGTQSSDVGRQQRHDMPQNSRQTACSTCPPYDRVSSVGCLQWRHSRPARSGQPRSRTDRGCSKSLELVTFPTGLTPSWASGTWKGRVAASQCRMGGPCCAAYVALPGMQPEHITCCRDTRHPATGGNMLCKKSLAGL